MTPTSNTEGLVFTGEDWFSRHEPLWKPIVETVRPQRILEIGSYEGRSTCYMIKACSVYKPLYVYCVDSWQGGIEHANENFENIEKTFDDNIAKTINHAQNRVHLYKRKGYSVVELSRLIVECTAPFDLIYIDGSHESCDVFVDAALSFHLLKVHGILIFDDYRAGNPHEVFPVYKYPSIGINAFLTAHRNKFDVLTFDKEDTGKQIPEEDIYQLYLRRRA